MQEYKKKRNNSGFKKVERLKRECLQCSKEFEVTPKQKKVYCSVACVVALNSELSKNRETITKKCISLYKKGLKIKDIASELNIKSSTVGSLLNKYNFRSNRQNIKDNKRKNKKIYTSCSICSYTRIVEMAHIIPASKGGTYAVENIIGLCPNHHHLFDHKALLIEEAEKLKNRIPNYEEYVLKKKEKKRKYIKSIDLETKEEVIFNSVKEIKAAGYDIGCVYKVLSGEFKQCYNKKWERVIETYYVQ